MHLVCNSLNFVSWAYRTEVAADLKATYQAATINEYEQYLAQFKIKKHDTYRLLRASSATEIALSRSLPIGPKFDESSMPPMRLNR